MNDNLPDNTHSTPIITFTPTPVIHKERKVKLMDRFPGKLAIVTREGSHAPGCAVTMLAGANLDELVILTNEWAAKHPGHLVVHLGVPIPIASGWAREIVYTCTLSEEEISALSEEAELFQEFVNARRAEKAEKQEAIDKAMHEAEEKARAQAEADFKEMKRLSELGKTHENNCGKKGKK